MKEIFANTRLGPGKLATIAMANQIIEEYATMGFTLTLRQLYYQFVARDLIPNKQSEYKRLGEAINDGRLCGLIDWQAITDLTRNVRTSPHWDNPESIIEAVAEQFAVDMWENQPYRVEVWEEKDALSGVIIPVCQRLRVPFFSCRGYTSQSEMYAGAQRLKSYLDNGQTPVIIHLGDHDPSGIDMTRDITDRLELFTRRPVEVRRIALNYNQVQEYNPPPNPAKETDSRVSGYISRYGRESWELDALAPPVLAALIESTITSFRDKTAWEAMAAIESDHRAQLQTVSERWADVTAYLE